MSLLVNTKQQQIAELERQIQLKKVQAEKALTRQKILLGSFFLDMLENNKLEGIREYTANNLDKHLTRNADKELLAPVIDNVKKLVKGLSLVKPIENTKNISPNSSSIKKKKNATKIIDKKKRIIFEMIMLEYNSDC